MSKIKDVLKGIIAWITAGIPKVWAFIKAHKKMVIGLAIAIIGVIVVLVVIVRLRKPAPEGLQVTQKSGAKISHSNWKVSGRTLTFDTKAEGKGEISTSVPKDIVPEVRNWKEKSNIIQIEGGMRYIDTNFYPEVGVKYLHRWSSFALGAGGSISIDTERMNVRSYGVNAVAQFMFS